MVGKSPDQHRPTRVLNPTEAKLTVHSPSPGHHPALCVPGKAVELSTCHPNSSTKAWNQSWGRTPSHSLSDPQLAEPVVAPSVDSSLSESQAVLLPSCHLGNSQPWKGLEEGNLGGGRVTTNQSILVGTWLG